MMPQTADVPGLSHDSIADLVLSVDGIVLERGVLEALVHREDAVRRGRQRRVPEDWLILDDGVVRSSGGEDRAWPGRVVDDAGGTRVRRTIVAERIQVGRVVIDAVVAAKHEFLAVAWRIGEAEPRSEVVLARRVQRIDVLADELYALAWNKHREAVVVIVERPKIFPADAVVQRQVRTEFERILREQGTRVHVVVVLHLSDLQGRGQDVARKEIAEALEIAVDSGVFRPRS